MNPGRAAGTRVLLAAADVRRRTQAETSASLRRRLHRKAAVVLAALLMPLAQVRAANVPVVVPPQASSAEQLAAADLARVLARLYVGEQFLLANALLPSGRTILVGCATNAMVRAWLEAGRSG